MDIRLNTIVKGIRKTETGFSVAIERDNRNEEIEADLVVHAAGRTPNLDELQLKFADVARETRGVSVNEYLQSTTNPSIYAAGDAAASGAPPLTPVASYEGSIVAHNLLHEDKRKVEAFRIPSVVFTIPPLASVGMMEEQARRPEREAEVKLIDTSQWFSTMRTGETCSAAKIITDRRSGEILGVHLLGPSADETINLFVLAMRAGVHASMLKKMLFTYPTHASDTAYML